MKQIIIFMFCVALVAPVVFADKIITTKRIPYNGKLVDCKDYTVSIKLSSRRTIKKKLAEISQIVATGNDALTKAEEAVKKKQFDQAATLYDDALESARSRWMKRLVEIRRFQALGKSGKIDKSVAQWIKRCDESPAAIGLVPTGVAAKSSNANNQAIAALENKIKTLEKDLDKNKVYVMAALNLKMKIQEANGNQDAVVITAEQLDAVTSGKPRPTVKPTKAAKKISPTPTVKKPARKPLKKPAAKVTVTPDKPVSTPKTTSGSKNIDVLENLLKAGKTDTVIERIQAGLKNYGNRQLPGALLLLGKGQLQKFEAGGKVDKKLAVAAGLNFMRVYANFRKAPQAPEALYLAGVTNSMVGDKTAAQLAMRQLIAEYVSADSKNEFVAKAKKKLVELGNVK